MYYYIPIYIMFSRLHIYNMYVICLYIIHIYDFACVYLHICTYKTYVCAICFFIMLYIFTLVI